MKDTRRTSVKPFTAKLAVAPPLENQLCRECGAPTVVNGVNQGHAFTHSKAKWKSRRLSSSMNRKPKQADSRDFSERVI